MPTPETPQAQTPRTDAALVTVQGQESCDVIGRLTLIARQLERELSAMSAESQRNREAGQMWSAKESDLRTQLAQKERELGEAERSFIQDNELLQGERTALRTQLLALHAASPQPAGEDSARLDWLISGGRVYQPFYEPRKWYAWGSSFPVITEGPHDTPRQAIDAAMLRPTSPEDGKPGSKP